MSPGKLRSMLLGVEKRRKEDEELESVISSSVDAAETGNLASFCVDNRNMRKKCALVETSIIFCRKTGYGRSISYPFSQIIFLLRDQKEDVAIAY